MNRSVGLLLILIVLFSGCNRKITSIFNKDLLVDRFEFDFLSAKAKIKYDNGKSSFSATANIRVKSDSLIWMSITPGLGVEAARVLINIDSVFFIDRLNKEYFVADISQLSDKYNFEFSYDMLEAIIIGNLIYPYSKETVTKEGKQVSYIQRKDDYLFNNYIGSESHKLERLFVTDLETNSSISVNYGDFQLVGNEVFPHLINASLEYETSETKKTNIEIGFNKAQIEDKPLRFPFNIPSKYSPM